MGSPRYTPVLWLGATLVLLLVSGCLGAGRPAAGPAASALPAEPGPNRVPAAALDVSATRGEVPLEVTFTIVASDLDGDNLTWFIDVDSDHASEESGRTLPGKYVHVFEQPGDYRIRATVTDGTEYVEAYGRVLAHAPRVADHPVPPIVFEGTISGAWAGQYIPGPNVHTFPLQVVPDEMRAHIDVGATAVDLDYVLHTPAGDWAAGEANANEPTGTVRPKTEGDLIVDDPRHLEQLGEWTLEVWAGSSIQGEYTVTITFE